MSERSAAGSGENETSELIEFPMFVRQLCSPNARTVHKGIAGLCEALDGRRSARMQHVENVEWFGWVGSALRRFAGVAKGCATSMALVRAAAILLALEGPLLARAMPDEIVIFLDTVLFLLEKPADDPNVTPGRRRELEWCLATAGFVPRTVGRPPFPWRPVSGALQLADATRSESGSPDSGSDVYVQPASLALRGLVRLAPPVSDAQWSKPHWPPALRRLVLPSAPDWATLWLGQKAADSLALRLSSSQSATLRGCWADAAPADVSRPPKTPPLLAATASMRWTTVIASAVCGACVLFVGMWYTVLPAGSNLEPLTAGITSCLSVGLATVATRLLAASCFSQSQSGDMDDDDRQGLRHWTGDDVAQRLLHDTALHPDALPRPPKQLRASFPIEWTDSVGAERVESASSGAAGADEATEAEEAGGMSASRVVQEAIAATAAGAGEEEGDPSGEATEGSCDSTEEFLEKLRAQVQNESQSADGQPASLPIPEDLLETLQELSRELHKAGSAQASEVDDAIQFVQCVSQRGHSERSKQETES